MKHWHLAIATALTTTLIAASAQAQVTPEEVWQNWQKLSATYGQALLADQIARDGDTLVVSGMKISMDQNGTKIDGRLDEVRFKDLGDGTVEITMSDSYPVMIGTIGSDDTPKDMAITLSQPGLRMIAGGSPGQTSYTFDAPTIGMTAKATEGAKTVADVTATLTGLTGSYLVATSGDISTLATNLEAQNLTFTVKAQDDTSDLDMNGKVAALKMATGGDFLGIAAMENLSQALKDGFNASGDFSYGAGSFSIDAKENGQATKIAGTNETGSFSFGIDDQRLIYGVGGTGMTVTISGDAIPFPEVKISYGEAGFDLTMPIAASETPSEFTFLTRIVDLSLPAEIWSIFDPTATLPRDPATLILESSGTATLKEDLFDEAATAKAGGTLPAEMNSLTISEITARAAGAELTGAGAFTFDNTDLVTFDGMPAPTGKMDMVLTGGNGLLDKLVVMGLIPQDQAMGARMMLAVIAKPGEGEDVLNSTVEFKDKGFFANGQRLK